jgi:hypothetical protein
MKLKAKVHKKEKIHINEWLTALERGSRRSESSQPTIKRAGLASPIKTKSPRPVATAEGTSSRGMNYV